MILAQSIPFSLLDEQAKYSLGNQSFSLWPKALDNETATDIDWLLYSTRKQDEERIAALLSSITNENIGIKWKPIHTTNGSNRKKDPSHTSEKIYALHIDCTSDKMQDIRKKLAIWYDSLSMAFPDGTKMRLVPVFLQFYL